MDTHIPASFIGIELMVYALFAWGLYDSARRSRFDALTLLSACLLGFLAEFMFATPLADLPSWLPQFLRTTIDNIRSGSDNGYDYNHPFLIMIAGIPLWIVLGWGSIIHAAQRTSRALGFGAVLGALAAGLLAASIDFALDPVANAIGYWEWWIKRIPADGNVQSMFGVPLDNYLGWLMIVGSLSFTQQLATDAVARWGARVWLEIASLLGAILGAFAIVIALQAVYDWLYGQITIAGTFMLIYGAAAMLTVTRLPWLRRDAPIDVWALALVGFYHVYLFAVMLWNHLYTSQHLLLAFMPLMSISSLIAFSWPMSARLLERFRSRHAAVKIEPASARSQSA